MKTEKYLTSHLSPSPSIVADNLRSILSISERPHKDVWGIETAKVQLNECAFVLPVVQMRRKVLQDPNSTNSYTVAWICALEEEYVCACRMLDEEFTGAEVIEENDDNTYVYGRIARHYLVIGCLPAGRYGTNSAARVARDMVRTFPNLRFALMVGIGGGVPSARNDIRLGDVVVSQPNNMCGGVIQYDLGKKLQNGRFQRVSQLNGPPEKLLGVIQELRRLYSDKRQPDRIAEHLQRMNDMEEFQRPAVDQLYKADYEHVDGIDCGQCDFHSVVQRPERRNRRVIHVHYGSIASGNSLLKDAIQRDLYANDPELNVLCFEMESAGLMNNLPCLVIRGICDYCDSHKNDAWHNYAALTAASYARELLLLLQPHRVSAMPYWDGQVALELSKVGQELISLNNNQRTVEMKVDSLDQKVDGVNLSVAKGAAFDCYDNQHSECLPGTRVELLGDIEDWSESPNGKCIFWLNGMAGTGKSTISRTIAALFNKKGLLGASFFFKRGEQDRGTAKKLFPTLAKQLLARIPHMSTEVRRSIESDPDISEKGLREQFKRLILDPLLQITHDQAEIQVSVIVIDAIDECENEDDIQAILQLLPQAQNFPSVRLRFLLTSRPELPIRLGFKGITGDHQDLVLHEIPSSIIERDIKIYFEERFLQLRKKRSLPSDWPGTKTIQDLSKRAAPLFISAATLCRFICDNNWMPEKRLKAILEDKSTYVSKMDSTYVPVLNQLLTGQDEWEARQLTQEFKDIVGVIILVFTPLSITALSRLLRIEIDDIQNRLDHLHSVLSIPGDLVTPVRPLHLSFRDFLLDPRQKSNSPFWIDQRAVHQSLMVQCLKVMGQNLRKNIYNLPNDSTQRSEIIIDSLDHFLPSELQYACRYWAPHLVQSMEPTAQLAKAISFLKLHFLHWVEAMSLLGIVSEAVAAIHVLQSIAQNSEISKYLHDMKRFILKNRHIADAGPLQLYMSGSPLGKYWYICCQCGDGPKPYNHQPQCTMCSHVVCPECHPVA